MSLESPQGNELLLGIGGEFMMAQFTSSGGDVPYVCAKTKAIKARDYVEFICGGTPTQIPPELCLSVDEGFKIAEHFFETGERALDAQWVEI